jgi:DNA-binding GntR family transcriptional regulator
VEENQKMSLDHAIASITRVSLHEELVGRVEDLIIDGTLPSGTKIPEKELCLKFGVSRTPMREALKVLAADGLITLEPNRGAWVRAITVAELEEVFPIMGALEALSGELACQNITDAEIESVRTAHTEMLEHYKDRNRQEYFQSNQRIHEIILEAAGNATLAMQYHSLSKRVRRARFLANMEEDRWGKAVEEHGLILSALERRAGAELALILKQHLENKFGTVRQWLIDQEQKASEPKT